MRHQPIACSRRSHDRPHPEFAGDTDRAGELFSMSSISIIGAGTMARILGTRALDGGNTVEVIGP